MKFAPFFVLPIKLRFELFPNVHCSCRIGFREPRQQSDARWKRWSGNTGLYNVEEPFIPYLSTARLKPSGKTGRLFYKVTWLKALPLQVEFNPNYNKR